MKLIISLELDQIYHILDKTYTVHCWLNACTMHMHYMWKNTILKWAKIKKGIRINYLIFILNRMFNSDVSNELSRATVFRATLGLIRATLGLIRATLGLIRATLGLIRNHSGLSGPHSRTHCIQMYAYH